jgi:NAD(P)-dependent dehydrogenase (short-subunit alcohol dehydrogenase family)
LIAAVSIAFKAEMSAARIDLAHAVVAITGGGRGIGRAAAELFAARGAMVCVADLDGESAATAAAGIGVRAEPFQVDVRSLVSFDQFVASVERTVGPIDVLVNNAGVMPMGPFLDESEATTDTVLAVNVNGPIHGMRLVLPGMLGRRRGHVVNVASMLGRTELPGLATYVASKHALVGLTNAVRSEVEGTGVTLTTVLPGVVNTELSSGVSIPFARLFRVEPHHVAKAIVDSCRNRPKEVAVPSWMGLYPALRPFIPDQLESLVRKLLGDDRAMAPSDPASRAAYSQRLAGQIADDE